MKKNIIATLGPSSLNKKIVQKMDLSGVDIFRINLSHTDIHEFEKIIYKIQKWTKKPVCPDTEGAQIRTGLLKNGPIKINTHEICKFVGSDTQLSQTGIPLSVKNLHLVLKTSDILKIDFDSAVVQLIEIGKDHIIGRVLSGGYIGSNKGLSVDRKISLPSFTEKDIKAVEIANNLGLKTIFLSFCSNANVVKKLRTYFNYKINVISKIENKSGLENLSEICKASEGVLIDRGDLSRDIPLEKIIYAQKYILNKAQSHNVPVYVATNLMESMIENSKPTRAEINDIVSVLEQGAAGLVLAAESAIGRYPVDCVRIMIRIINEVKRKINSKKIDQLFSIPMDRIIEPHGGELVQQHIEGFSDKELDGLPYLLLDEKYESDVIQISEGTYSPLRGFMNLDQMMSVLKINKLPNGTIWTLPILLQVNRRKQKSLPDEGQIALKSNKNGEIIALLNIESIQKIESLKNLAKIWFGTDSIDHPGVLSFYNAGDYIISGKPFLIKKRRHSYMNSYELTPKQTRDVFNHRGWHNIIGFHTRNVCHRGHEYIQKQALKRTDADAIFISPVTGVKKKGDFTAEILIQSYAELMKKGVYDPYGVLLGSFNTYSRYCGPKEAVFTAICRKNYGCNYFIIGRDHTGVGNYYNSNESIKIFDQLDIGMKIIKFDTVSYSDIVNDPNTNLSNKKAINSKLPLSGTIVRNSLEKGKNIPEYLMRKEIIKMISEKYMIEPNSVLED